MQQQARIRMQHQQQQQGRIAGQISSLEKLGAEPGAGYQTQFRQEQVPQPLDEPRVMVAEEGEVDAAVPGGQ